MTSPPSPSSSSSLPLTITPLHTLPSPSHTRSWHSAPHPNPTIPLLATSTSDRTILIHNLLSRRLHSTIQGGHKRSVRSCSWRPTSRPSTTATTNTAITQAAARSNKKVPLVLASGSFDATAGIWRYAAGGGGREVDEAADGDVDGDVDEEEEEEEEEEEGWKFEVLLEGHDSEIKSVAWNRSGRLLATCSRDKSVWIWEDINYANNADKAAEDEGGEAEGEGEGDYETIAVLQEHEGDVKCVAWHPTEDVLVSASYDDEIRVYREDEEDDGEWRCVSVLRGHESTVWCVVFEPAAAPSAGGGGPRLASASADKTVRIWRRLSAQQQMSQVRGAGGGNRYPSTIISREEEAEEERRGHAGSEEWDEECILPAAHQWAVYSLAWSGETGRIVSTGEDGRVVVYEEEEQQRQIMNGVEDRMDDNGGGEGQEGTGQWVIVARLEAAHGVWEVNCVCWWAGKRGRGSSRGNQDRVAGENEDDEEEDDGEILITTGDDGLVKMWSILVEAHRQQRGKMGNQARLREMDEKKGEDIDGPS
ncbi:MAG: Cytosolic iron-sulfur protein assembly protein [Peltula sp. TS41687]|nr:MAG: Cytosolic iron-sulfur protein assembly protein [Peltula sp. TS41687]